MKQKKAKSAGFQVMGLSAPVLKGVLHRGYKFPTPIQRKTIPFILEGKDVLAMARTGSGKTAAFLIPLLEKLKVHSSKVGVRALILAPTRELALQTLSFAKGLGKYTNLRAACVLGGESIENQFAAMHENPDIIIATPGRFSHLCVEMNLKLDSVEYVVFDEADRLFEMGFQEQLNELLMRLPPLRQTVLFSATLPRMLVEFARAGLSDPTLIRLDVESKISENLKLGFFKVNSEDKIPLLIHLVMTVIKENEQTVIFAPTKYHVEYIHSIFSNLGISSTYVYSTLDPSARKINIAKFRLKKLNLLIVTDVAARGIDIPLLDVVINYDFPPKVKLFIHRVGRVARAGRSGTAYSLVSPDEVCYLLDLSMFLNGSIKLCSPEEEDSGISNSENSDDGEKVENSNDRMFGKVPQSIIDENHDCLRKLVEPSFDLKTLRDSANNALSKYMRTRPPASNESSRRLKGDLWGKFLGYHPIFKSNEEFLQEQRRMKLLEKLNTLRPKTTIFDVKEETSSLKNPRLIMADKRKRDEAKIKTYHDKYNKKKSEVLTKLKEDKKVEEAMNKIEKSSEGELLNSFTKVVGGNKRKRRANETDTQQLESETETKKDFFIPYAPSDHYEEQGYSVISNFEKASSKAMLDLNNDEKFDRNQNRPKVKWDRTHKKFRVEEQVKKIKTESGAWVPSTYKKDLYRNWKLRMQPNENADSDEENEHKSEVEEKRNVKGRRGFVALNESSKISNKPHPLVKGRKREKIVHINKGPKQVFTYEEVEKRVKEKEKKWKFFRKREDQKKRNRGKKKPSFTRRKK